MTHLFKARPQGGAIMKINTINLINTPYRTLSFKSDDSKQPQVTVQTPQGPLPADVLQFKQAVKPKTSFISKVIKFLKDFAEEPKSDLAKDWDPTQSVVERAGLRAELL